MPSSSHTRICPEAGSSTSREAWKLRPESEEWLEEAMTLVSDEEDVDLVARFRIESLAEAVPEAYLRRLIPIARALPEDKDRALALLAIAVSLPPAERAALTLEASAVPACFHGQLVPSC